MGLPVCYFVLRSLSVSCLEGLVPVHTAARVASFDARRGPRSVEGRMALLRRGLAGGAGTPGRWAWPLLRPTAVDPGSAPSGPALLRLPGKGRREALPEHTRNRTTAAGQP